MVGGRSEREARAMGVWGRSPQENFPRPVVIARAACLATQPSYVSPALELSTTALDRKRRHIVVRESSAVARVSCDGRARTGRTRVCAKYPRQVYGPV